MLSAKDFDFFKKISNIYNCFSSCFGDCICKSFYMFEKN